VGQTTTQTGRRAPRTSHGPRFGQASQGREGSWRRILRIPECQRSVAAVASNGSGPAAPPAARAMHGPSDSRIGAAATDVAVQGVVDGRVVRIRVAAKRATTDKTMPGVQ